MRSFESHITLDPKQLTTEDRKNIEAKSKVYRFHAGDISLDRDSVDAWMNLEKAYFVTGHGLTYSNIEVRTKNLVIALQYAGYKVLRYKIEDILVDSKIADEWHILDTKD